jgi:hypothetical protein
VCHRLYELHSVDPRRLNAPDDPTLELTYDLLVSTLRRYAAVGAAGEGPPDWQDFIGIVLLLLVNATIGRGAVQLDSSS